MTHARQQIRDAAAALLVGLTTTGNRVEIGRTRQLPPGHEPTLLIYTTPAVSGGQETSRAMTLGRPRRLERIMSLTVMGWVEQAEPCDDTLDLIASEVEVAMAGDPTLGDLVKDTELTSTVSQVDAEGTKHKGAIRLIYTVTYHTIENAPQTAV